MKNILILLILLCLSFVSQAEIIHCSGSLNSDESFITSVDLQGDKKTRVHGLGDSEIFLSRENSSYSLEVYTPSQSSRSYSEGLISETSTLSFSRWTRTQLFSVECYKK
jgi:hypothetical protein